jgi:hypothetical protein
MMESIPEADEDEDKTNNTCCFCAITELLKKIFIFTKYARLTS